jgi:pantoate--beta-alanine ligase
MGALHEGHMALLHEARAQGAGFVVASIFVNPLQFGPHEDYHRYPRTLDADRARCKAAGVDVIHAPDARLMYPEGFQTTVAVQGIAEPLEGAYRPGHFAGVTTVVAKLFNAVGPCIAVFGRKDYQQWKVVERMVRDLDFPVEVIGYPTVREPDGLALSSRNRYLSADERQRARSLVGGLRAASELFASGTRDAFQLERALREPLEEAGAEIDYATIVHPETLKDVGERAGERALGIVAARIGSTRLIDNALLGQERLEPRSC